MDGRLEGKLEKQKAEMLSKAIQASSKYVEPADLHRQMIAVKKEFYCGYFLVVLGMVLLVLWMRLGGRNGLWLPLLLFLFDLPLWLF